MSQDVWLSLLAGSFGLWALVVGWASTRIVRQIDRGTDSLEKLDDKISEFVTATERRLTRLETRQDTLVSLVNELRSETPRNS